MRTSPIPVLTATLAIAIGIAGCGRDEETPPPQPTETPTLPSPAVPESVPPPGGTAAPGGTIPTPPPMDATAGPVAGSDRSFVAEAMTSGVVEAEAGKMAAEKAGDPQVKAYGDQLQKDHSATNMKLAQLASTKGITAAETIEGDARTQLDDLAKLSGAEFDHAFIERFGVSAHEKTIALFEREAKEGQDPDIRAFAEQTLVTLRSHLQAAQQLGQGAK
ncbi:DUF4142 domain-containing protein [Aromatoleum sp.]|uniref:DUF4142 domain-containing protein n=1 Tax=Aromatoleum sp. TaxID=2307007 RepID=UPI002FC929AD